MVPSAKQPQAPQRAGGSMRFLFTPHPTFRCAEGHPLPQRERGSKSSRQYVLKENIANTVRITSPLVGEVATRGQGEGYLKIFQNLKSCPKILYFVSVAFSCNPVLSKQIPTIVPKRLLSFKEKQRVGTGTSQAQRQQSQREKTKFFYFYLLKHQPPTN